mgnify:CR=1 FL=1|tara:strand:- start:1287 stop:1619 length:333 start_codon:yes stop_codon:yes gene_type:complete
MKLQYSEGKYKGLTASGKDYDTTVKNLEAKKNRLEKKELLNSLTYNEIKSLHKLLDCQLSISDKDFNSDVELDGDCWGFTEMKQVKDLCLKLQLLGTVKAKEEGVDSNEY